MVEPNTLAAPALLLSVAFAAALLSGFVISVWLCSRQIRHVTKHRAVVPPAFTHTIALAAHQKAADYTVAKAKLGLIEIALGVALLLGWTLLGGLDTINQFLLAHMGGGMLQQLALLGSFTLIAGVVDLPLAWYQTFVLEARFGFNKMTLGLWISDLIKSAAMGSLIGLPIAAAILWLMSATGPAWWLWAWGLWMGFNLLLLMIYPTFIAPLFNQFRPLEDETLKARVTALMQRCGFAAKGLFVMDGSKRSAHGNAYFSGFGATKRVVFYDTLLSKLSPGEVAAVLAHELGHFKHKHIIKRIVTMFAMSLAGFALLGWLAVKPWFYVGLGVTPNLGAPNDALALLLFVLVIPTFGLFVSPLFAQLSRRHEFEADAYAVAHTSASELGSALLKLYEDNASTLTPDPVYVKFHYSHPPASERLARLHG
jgi:STE24 endopeptidase